MIEFCTPKRTVITIAVFLLISAAVLFLENYYTDHTDIKEKFGRTQAKKFSTKSQDTTQTLSPDEDSENAEISDENCWQNEEFEVIDSCLECSDFDRKAGHKDYCQKSGYYDKLRCVKSEKEAFRSCEKVPWLEARNFNIFVSTMAICGGVFSWLSNWRMKILDRKAFARVQQQLADGV